MQHGHDSAVFSCMCNAFVTDLNDDGYGLVGLLHAKDANGRLRRVQCHSYMLNRLRVATRISFAWRTSVETLADPEVKLIPP